MAVYPFSFQSFEEGFGYSIVVTVALAAHALNHTVLLELFLERLAGILNTTVRMQNDASRQLPLEYGHIQRRVHRCFGGHLAAELLADDLPIEQFENDRKILPPACGSQVYDVSTPDLKRDVDREFLTEEVRRYRLVVVRIIRHLELSSGFGPEPHRSHQSGHTGPTALQASLSQFICNTWAPKGFIVLLMDRLNSLFELLSLFAALAFWSLCPPVIPVGRYTQYTTWVRYALLGLKPWLSLRETYARYLESSGTKAYSIAEARVLFAKISEVNIRTVLTHLNLLESGAGQRHCGPLLSLAPKPWPREAIQRLLPGAGLFMLIEAKK